jgi:hypothetical protein|tara:strand:+ start:266 stop:493 length:228 start_codon:yes stop_codon:yes gene_type:complete
MMLNITRTSPVTAAVTTMELDITMDQYARWRGGELIQQAMPNLTLDEREFIITGITKTCWDKLMKNLDAASNLAL